MLIARVPQPKAEIMNRVKDTANVWRPAYEKGIFFDQSLSL